MTLITKSDCADVLKAVLGDVEFQLEDFSMKYFSELMGFHANHAGLTIQAIVNGEVKEFRFFVKTAVDNPVIKDKYWDVLRQFYKEHMFFTRVHKDLQQFVDQKITADCYLSKLEQFAVLEDLCGKGYETSRVARCEMNHADKALQAFANFHAASIIHEEKTGIIIDQKYKDLNYESLLFETDNRPNAFLLYSVDTGVRAVAERYLEHIPADDRNALFSKVRRRITQLLQHPKRFRKVVCQGDPWGNNILYKYTNNGEPKEAILIDFGTLRIGPPALDVMLFLYLGTPSEFRVRHKAQMKDIYYAHLSAILTTYGLDPSHVLPRSQFFETCDVYEEFGLCMRIYYEYVTRLPKEYLIKAAGSVDKFLGMMIYGNPELGMEAFENSEIYRKGVTEAIEDAYRYYKRSR